VPQGALDEPGMHTGFEEMGGVGMPERMDSHACFGDASPVFGRAEGALDTGATHGIGSRRTLFLIAPRGGKEPGPGTVGVPGGAEQREGLCGQGAIPVFGARAAVDMDLEALAIDRGDLQGEACMEPESYAVDGGEGDVVVHGGGGCEEPPDLLHTADGGETV